MTLKTTAYKKLFLFEKKKKPDETVKTFYPKKRQKSLKKTL